MMKKRTSVPAFGAAWHGADDFTPHPGRTGCLEKRRPWRGKTQYIDPFQEAGLVTGGPAQDWGWARQRGIFRVCSLTEVDAWPGF